MTRWGVLSGIPAGVAAAAFAEAAARLRANIPPTGRSARQPPAPAPPLSMPPPLVGAGPGDAAARPASATSSTAMTSPTDYRVIRPGPHFLQYAGNDGFDFHRGLVGLHLDNRTAALDLLARLDQPSHHADFRPGGGQVGHLHLESHALCFCRLFSPWGRIATRRASPAVRPLKLAMADFQGVLVHERLGSRGVEDAVGRADGGSCRSAQDGGVAENLAASPSGGECRMTMPAAKASPAPEGSMPRKRYAPGLPLVAIVGPPARRRDRG